MSRCHCPHEGAPAWQSHVTRKQSQLELAHGWVKYPRKRKKSHPTHIPFTLLTQLIKKTFVVVTKDQIALLSSRHVDVIRQAMQMSVTMNCVLGERACIFWGGGEGSWES